MDWGMKDAALGGFLCFGVLALAGCATPPAKDFGGRWRPLNQFQSAPERIQLQRPYVFYASPLDGTLKNMLTRWAQDTGMRLVYKLPYDYTLYTPVSDIRGQSISDAVAKLSSIYSAEHVAITTVGQEIIVESASATSPVASVAKDVAESRKPSAEPPSPTH
jgi:hypothetical protein